MKFFIVEFYVAFCFVALFTRAWIEIPYEKAWNMILSVALFTRAWIEIIT